MNIISFIKYAKENWIKKNFFYKNIEQMADTGGDILKCEGMELYS